MREHLTASSHVIAADLPYLPELGSSPSHLWHHCFDWGPLALCLQAVHGGHTYAVSCLAVSGGYMFSADFGGNIKVRG